MRRSCMVRSQTTPLRIVPQRGQVSEDGSEVAVRRRKQSWYVFQECVGGTYFAKNVGCRGPHVTGVVHGSLSARNTKGLAGKSSSNDLDHAFIRFRVLFAEFADVTKYRSFGEDAIDNPLVQNLLAVLIVFNVADGTPAKQMGTE